jgi:hypothetical protein
MALTPCSFVKCSFCNPWIFCHALFPNSWPRVNGFVLGVLPDTKWLVTIVLMDEALRNRAFFMRHVREEEKNRLSEESFIYFYFFFIPERRQMPSTWRSTWLTSKTATTELESTWNRSWCTRTSSEVEYFHYYINMFEPSQGNISRDYLKNKSIVFDIS